MQQGSTGDREMMLKQIESLKNARQEAEHLRQECHRLQQDLSATTTELSDVRRHHNDALQRLKDQSDALLYALNYQKAKVADEGVMEQVCIAKDGLCACFVSLLIHGSDICVWHSIVNTYSQL